MQANKDYQLKLSIIEKEKLTDLCEWVVNEDDLLLLARLISNSELEELGEKIQVELLKTLLK